MRYLSKYFSGGRLLKRSRDESTPEIDETSIFTRDTSRPPKRFRRDYNEWEFCLALITWIFENHKHIQPFLDSEHETLDVVMKDTQTLLVKEKEVRIKDVFSSDAKKQKRLRESMQRVIENHHNYSIKVEELSIDASASAAFNHPMNIDRGYAWPMENDEIKNLKIDARLIVMKFKWQDWDGKSW
jgi:hypothetical protein